METPPNNLNLHELQPEKNSNKRISTNINKKTQLTLQKKEKVFRKRWRKNVRPSRRGAVSRLGLRLLNDFSESAIAIYRKINQKGKI